MKRLSVTDVARNFRAVLDAVEQDQEPFTPGSSETGDYAVFFSAVPLAADSRGTLRLVGGGKELRPFAVLYRSGAARQMRIGRSGFVPKSRSEKSRDSCALRKSLIGRQGFELYE